MGSLVTFFHRRYTLRTGRHLSPPVSSSHTLGRLDVQSCSSVCHLQLPDTHLAAPRWPVQMVYHPQRAYQRISSRISTPNYHSCSSLHNCQSTPGNERRCLTYHQFQCGDPPAFLDSSWKTRQVSLWSSLKNQQTRTQGMCMGPAMGRWERMKGARPGVGSPPTTISSAKQVRHQRQTLRTLFFPPHHTQIPVSLKRWEGWS